MLRFLSTPLLIVELREKQEIKDPPSSSSRLGEQAVVEPLVDKGGAQP